MCVILRFLSIFYPPAEYYKINIEQAAEKELFVCSSKVLKSKGFLEVVNADKENKNDIHANISKLEELSEGEEIAATYDISQSMTQAPKRYTSGSMVVAMESAGNMIDDEELRSQIRGSGIGTPATRAEIITKLIRNGYMCLDDKTQILIPHADGEALYDIVNEILPDLLSPEMTAELEQNFSRIENGELNPAIYHKQMNEYIMRNIDKIKELNEGKNYEGDFSQNKESVGKCPVCGKPVYEYSKSFSCSGYNLHYFSFVNLVCIFVQNPNADKALVISLGIKGAELSENVSVEENEVSEKQQETISMFQYMGQQLRFWQDIEVKASLIKTEIARLDDEIKSVLNYIEETNYNAAQGYKVYKVLRDKQNERKILVKESKKVCALRNGTDTGRKEEVCRVRCRIGRRSY